MTVAQQIETLPRKNQLKSLDSLAYLGSLAQLAGRSAHVTFVGPRRAAGFIRSGRFSRPWRWRSPSRSRP